MSNWTMYPSKALTDNQLSCYANKVVNTSIVNVVEYRPTKNDPQYTQQEDYWNLDTGAEHTSSTIGQAQSSVGLRNMTVVERTNKQINNETYIGSGKFCLCNCWIMNIKQVILIIKTMFCTRLISLYLLFTVRISYRPPIPYMYLRT